MGYISMDRFWKIVIVAFVAGLYFLGYATISSQPANRNVPILPMRGVVALPSLEASPHVEWKLSPEMTTPEEVVKFVNSRELHSFQVLTDVHQGGWHFHVIYE